MNDGLEEVFDARKRTRKGERFADPRQVNLHGVDFTFEDAKSEMTDSQQQWYAAYRTKCLQEIARLRNATGTLLQQRSEGMLTEVEPVKVPLSASSSRDPWESHYVVNKGLFPVKNYIVHAFGDLVPDGFDFDAAMKMHEPDDSVMDEVHQQSPSPRSADQADEGAALKACANHQEDHSASPVDSPKGQQQHPTRIIMECGCGSGSTILPLMRLFPRDRFVCYDVSKTAVQMLQNHRLRACAQNASIFVCDIAGAVTSLEHAMSAHAPDVQKGSVDFVLLVFVLCALPTVGHMVSSLRQLRQWLHPTQGKLLLRDFAILDHNFFRYHTQGNAATAESNGVCFRKGDGTQQSFFEMDYLVDLLALAGFVPCLHGDGSRKVEYHCNRLVNRKNGKTMNKVFINGTFAPAS